MTDRLTDDELAEMRCYYDAYWSQETRMVHGMFGKLLAEVEWLHRMLDKREGQIKTRREIELEEQLESVEQESKVLYEQIDGLKTELATFKNAVRIVAPLFRSITSRREYEAAMQGMLGELEKLT